MRVRSWAAAACLTALVTSATLVGTGTGAAAIPTNCEVSFGSNPATVSSLCLSGTGEHRIRMLLQHFNPTVGLIPIVGPWKPVGQASTSTYPPHTIINVWIDKRN